MTAHLTKTRAKNSKPIWLCDTSLAIADGGSGAALVWAKANGFDGKAGSLLLVPNEKGEVSGALFGVASQTPDEQLSFGKLATGLPAGDWHFVGPPANPELATLGFLLGGYRFDKYRKSSDKVVSLTTPEGIDQAAVERIATAVYLARDLINTPANDMGPQAI